MTEEGPTTQDYDRKGRLIDLDPESPTECEHVGRGDDHFVYQATGVKLCWECVSEFVSWMLDGGQQGNPEAWTWALEEHR